MSTLSEFIYLQFLDVLTTIAFLVHGVGEANPLVRWVMQEAPDPLSGLVGLKVGAVAMACYCMYKSRHALLRKVNIFFACIVAYNLVVIIISATVAA